MTSRPKKNVIHLTARVHEEKKAEIPSDLSSIREMLLNSPEPQVLQTSNVIELNFLREILSMEKRGRGGRGTGRGGRGRMTQRHQPTPNKDDHDQFPLLSSNAYPNVIAAAPVEDTIDWTLTEDDQVNEPIHDNNNSLDNTNNSYTENTKDNENNNNNDYNNLNEDNHNSTHDFTYENHNHYHSFNDWTTTTQTFVDLEAIKQELNQLEDLYQNGFLQEDEYNIRKEKLEVQLPLVEEEESTAKKDPIEDTRIVEGKNIIEEDEGISREEERASQSQDEDSFEPDEMTEPVTDDIEDVSAFTEVSAMELLKQKMVEKGSSQTADKVTLEALLRQTQKGQNAVSEVPATIREYPFVPLITHADLSRLNCDVVVLPTGCFVTSGVMDSMTTRYGTYLPIYLRKKFKVGRYPSNLPPYKNRTARDFQNLKAMGGLSQGFSAYVNTNELRDFAEDKTVAPIVLCVVGGDYDGQITVESISIAVKNVFKVLSSQVPNNKSITVAFPAFGIGKGSLSRDRVPALYSQVEAMSEDFTESSQLPVLVTYSDTIQRLALAARTKLFKYRGDKELPRVLRSDAEMAVIPELQSELEADRLALFVGAGVSLSAGLPSWSQFVQNLAAKAGMKPQKSEMTTEELLNVSEQAKQLLGAKFGSAFRESLGYLPEKFNPGPTLTHYYVASLSKSIVTTNYDDLLEQALANMKKAAFVINTPQDVARVPMGEQVNVLKIHGDITNPKESVLTRSDYESYFAKRPAVSTMLKGLLLNRTFLFVGYSLRDLNLQIILNEVSQMLRDARRPAFAVVFESTDSERQYWAERGVQLLTVTGDSARDKTVSLWQLLDVLQMKYFAPHGAWLAEDAADLFPEHSANELDASMTRLRSSMYRLLSEWERDPSPELADFLFPFLMTASKHGLNISRESWNLLAKHYANRTPATEVTHLMALSAAIAALQQSGGRAEHHYRDYLHQLQNDFMK